MDPEQPDRATRAVFARHAASLIVLRESQVLMGVRNAGHRFMPNRLVFPGGAVDPEDASAVAATEPNPALLAMLGRTARPRLARAVVLAAARELREEVGLSLGTPPHLDAVHYLCRAVTPPESSIRFNARFLVVDASATEGVARDSMELREVGFRPIEAVLQDKVAPVTREVLERLRTWLQLAPEERLARTALPVFKQKRWRTE